MRTPEEISRLIPRHAEELGFEASSNAATGEVLALLAASKPGGRILELGTGMGAGLAWLAHGADRATTIVTVELEPTLQAVARDLVPDPRIEFVIGDAGPWLTYAAARGDRFDLVFADAWPGKFSHLDEALRLVGPGGFFVVDDLRTQPHWDEEHQARVEALLPVLEGQRGWRTMRLGRGNGMMVLARRSC